MSPIQRNLRGLVTTQKEEVLCIFCGWVSDSHVVSTWFSWSLALGTFCLGCTLLGPSSHAVGSPCHMENTHMGAPVYSFSLCVILMRCQTYGEDDSMIPATWAFPVEDSDLVARDKSSSRLCSHS